MQMRRCHALRRWFLATPIAATVAACASFFGEVPGLYYSVQLKDPVPRSACIDLASEIAAQLPLHVTSDDYPFPKKQGACIASLRSTTLKDELSVAIFSSPVERRVLLDFKEKQVGRFEMVTPKGTDADLVSEAVALTQWHFPEAVITTFRKHTGWLGP